MKGEPFPLKAGRKCMEDPWRWTGRESIFSEEEKEKRKARLGFPADSFFILSVGELNQNKNHRTVIRALSQMEETDICYGICGRGESRKELEKLIEKEGLADRVKLLGYRKDIEEILPAADCFLFLPGGKGLAWQRWRRWRPGCRLSHQTAAAPENICGME